MELYSVSIISVGVHFWCTKTLKWKSFSLSTASLASSERTFRVTGIIGDVAPSSPMMPLCRSCRSAPTISVALAILLGWNWLASVSTTSLFASGMSTGPRLKSGCPKASTRLPSL